jgi:predicted Fe-Mo cluster-binding NifX family protein
MKIAVSAAGDTIESGMDMRFGRAPYFIIIDQDTGEYKTVDNGAAQSSGGAGIAAAQMIVDKGVNAVITGNVGPNAMRVLAAGDIPVYGGRHATVRENIEEFKKGLLEMINTTVPAHFGMGGQGR